MEIRLADINDIDEIGKLYYDTVTTVNKKDYSKEQIQAWTSTFNNQQGWVRRIKEQCFFVAVIDKKIVGFASLDNSGYLDLLYIHKDFLRRGIATRLFKKIEDTAKEQEFDEIIVQSSITAKPFFEKMGFNVTGEKHKLVDGIAFTNTLMLKKIAQTVLSN